MKIVQIMATSGGGLGGLEQHTFNLVNALAQEHEVHLIADAAYAQYLKSNVIFHRFNFKRSRWNPFLIYELLKLIREIKPELLHAQAGKAAAILAPWLKQIQCPTVATIHGMKNNLTPFLKFQHVIAVSDKIRQKFGSFSPITTIYNGIKLIQTNTIFQNKPYIQALAVGRLVDVKGFLELIEAWHDIDAKLWIVGKGNQRPLLEQKIQQLNLEDKVTLLGHRTDVNELLLQSDCLIISSFKEGGPITLAEALLTETPVLATDVGMVSAFLPSDYICDNNTPVCMNKLFKAKLRSRQTMQIELKHSFEHANNALSFDQMVQQTELLYDQLVKQNTE